MTDYLEPLLDRPEDEEKWPLLRLRGWRGTRLTEGGMQEEHVRQTPAAQKPKAMSARASSEAKTAQGDAPLYAAMERARSARRRGERTERSGGGNDGFLPPRSGQRAQTPSETGRRRPAELWTTPDGAPARTRYAQLVDAEFQRDARRYDGAMGLL